MSKLTEQAQGRISAVTDVAFKFGLGVFQQSQSRLQVFITGTDLNLFDRFEQAAKWTVDI
jgi:hypothetical protein